MVFNMEEDIKFKIKDNKYIWIFLNNKWIKRRYAFDKKENRYSFNFYNKKYYVSKEDVEKVVE